MTQDCPVFVTLVVNPPVELAKAPFYCPYKHGWHCLCCGCGQWVYLCVYICAYVYITRQVRLLLSSGNKCNKSRLQNGLGLLGDLGQEQGVGGRQAPLPGAQK